MAVDECHCSVRQWHETKWYNDALRLWDRMNEMIVVNHFFFNVLVWSPSGQGLFAVGFLAIPAVHIFLAIDFV